MFRWLLLIVLAVAVLLGLTVGMLNPQQVRVDLFFYSGTLPLGAVMLLCFIAGMIVALFVGALRRLMRLTKHSSE